MHIINLWCNHCPQSHRACKGQHLFSKRGTEAHPHHKPQKDGKGRGKEKIRTQLTRSQIRGAIL